MQDITMDMFREETITTSTHKFRSPEDVVTPFLYSGVIRAVDPVTRMHPKYHVEVTVEPEDEMSKFVLLSLHGIPKPPKKEQVRPPRTSVPAVVDINLFGIGRNQLCCYAARVSCAVFVLPAARGEAS